MTGSDCQTSRHYSQQKSSELWLSMFFMLALALFGWPSQSEATQYEEILWENLIPEEDLQALINPPDYVTEVEDGSFEDQIASQMVSTLEQGLDDQYQRALVSTRVVDAMAGKAIRIPGFVVPLEYDDDMTITQFFLVPFFGACIHVPPPPPNQIILIDAPQGITLENLYDPFWISGVLETQVTENEIATSAYRIQMKEFERYTE
ncbi:MAG: DUF3299 domain-containing protein [Oceanobacter sp.]